MWQVDPNTREGQVWIQKFNEHFYRWLQSGRTQDDLLVAAADDLKNLLERSPDSAARVQAIALTTTFNARLSAGPQAVSALARIGNHADLFVVERDPERSAARILLSLYQTEADLQQRNQYSGLDALTRAEQLMAQDPPAAALAGYLDGYRWYLRGALAELGLASGLAANAYADAAKTLDKLATETENLVEVSAALIGLLFGPAIQLGDQQQATQVLMLASNQVRILAARNAFGRIRAEAMSRPDHNLSPLASQLWPIIIKAGIPNELGPVDIFPLVTALPANEAQSCAAMLIEKIGGARGKRDDWCAVFYSALLAHSPSGAARKEWLAEAESALGNVEDPLIEAFVHSRLLMSKAAARTSTKKLTKRFLGALRRLTQEQESPLEDLRVRALFDEAVALSLDWARREFTAEPNAFNRTQLAVLLDALRGSKVSEMYDVWNEVATPRGSAESGLMLALDRLQRIWRGLADQPDAAAIILQRLPSGYLFVCITGSEAEPFRLIDAGQEFETAALKLARIVQADVDLFAVTGDLPVDDSVLPAGKIAFEALPQALQKIIAVSKTLLVVPDFRANSDDLPFELFHDGQNFLGANRIIARFTSLRALTRAVEHLARTLPHKRALVTSASSVEGWPELPLARAEAESLRGVLTKAGWDAPVIEESRLSPAFFTDRLEYISLLHVAAHGQIAVDEAIILPANQRLTIDDLLRRRFPQLPIVYLNTCSLGQSRYVGGGISRGIAHTLVTAGAPAAIANMLPVEDGKASDLALEFYAQAKRHAVGEALRRARAKLAKQGTHPILWGSTVLIGDPWVRLAPQTDELSVADQFLQAHFSLAHDDAALADASRELVVDRGNVRLQAAAELVRACSIVTDFSDPQHLAEWDLIIRLADEIDNLPAIALTRFVRITKLDASMDPANSMRLIDAAIYYLEPMAAIDETWKRLLLNANTIKARLDLELRGLSIQTHGANETQDDELEGFMDVILGAQAQQEAAVGRVAVRQPELSLDDVFWNSIVIGHQNRFEDMPEVFAFASQLVNKLRRMEAIPVEAMPYAPVVLAGFLYFIWSSQNVSYLAPEMAEGWAQSMKVAAAELARDWAPPTDKRWFVGLNKFPQAVDEALKRLDALGYMEIYDHLDPEMAKLGALAKATLSTIETDFGQALAPATGWVMGTIIQKNTFSPLDGSVPEDIGERLKRIYYELEGTAEGRFMSWLMAGFQGVREDSLDELQRWRLGVETDQPKPKKPANRKSAR